MSQSVEVVEAAERFMPPFRECLQHLVPVFDALEHAAVGGAGAAAKADIQAFMIGVFRFIDRLDTELAAAVGPRDLDAELIDLAGERARRRDDLRGYDPPCR